MKSKLHDAAFFLGGLLLTSSPGLFAAQAVKAVPLTPTAGGSRVSSSAQAVLGRQLSALRAARASQEDAEGPESVEAVEVTLPVSVSEELEARLDDADLDIDALYTLACAEHGEAGPLLEELQLLIADEAQPEARRRVARWTRAMILRRSGDFEGALAGVEEFALEEQNFEAKLQRAELLDARGKLEEAVGAYEELLPLVSDEEQETHVRLRLALLQMERGTDQQDALAEFALEEGRDRELRNRAAVVLALLERPADAIALYEVDEADPKRFRQEVRIAEWAVRAGDAAVAQDYAWRAVRSAKIKRDRYYGLTLLVEAHRLDDSLDGLVDKLAGTEALDADSRRTWIELLRERGRYDEAIELFKSAAGESFGIEERRQLLEMYREKGDEEVMVGVYRDLIAEEPTEVEWREGLSRTFLERGDRAGAVTLWQEFLHDPACANRQLEAAEVLMALGLDELAIEAAERTISSERGVYAALIFLFDLHKNRGRLAEAEAALERMEAIAPPEAAERFQLADAWEQLGRQDRAVVVLESVRTARGEGESGEDLEMRLAWLYSEVGQEEVALERWREIWLKIKAVGRRRYAEDRMMTVASRLGSLADIAIDLEQKLVAGTASERDSGLLVRLYTKVGDPVSAAEVIDEFMRQSGGSVLDTLQEKGRVYLACNDYYNYEKVVRELIELDPEGEGDYLRQLAMSQLERGKPDEAREVLSRLKVLEMGTESAEFEAGVLALAGLREDAIKAYRKGVATNPGRIESYLLMANLMKEMGEVELAVGMFQHLAESAEKDDLFTIAIDGLLNVEAPKPVMQWARRITLERLAQRHDKMYLYQLLADLAEQVEEREGMLTALENSLAISGERRPSVLRELMDLAKGQGTSFTGRGWEGDPQRHLAYGRRLIGLSEVVPPQVYLDLGEAFLKAHDPVSATKTFRLASDLPDYAAFERQAAGLFEQAGYRDEALALYKRVLVAQSNDVGLMVKIGELQEQGGRDEAALRLYREGLELLFSRQPLSTLKAKKEEKRGSFFAWYGSRNIDDFDKYYGRLLKNLLVVLPGGGPAEALMEEQRARVLADLAALKTLPEDSRSAEEAQEMEDVGSLDQHPRVRSRANFYRRLAIAYERPSLAEELDLALLAAFPDDDELLENLCQARIGWGLYGSVRRLLDLSQRDAKEVARLRFLVGDGLDERTSRKLPLDQAVSLFLPLLMEGKGEEAGVLLRRADFTSVTREDVGKVEPLFSATLYLGDPDLTLFIAREWVRLHVKHSSGSYMVQSVMQKCRNALGAEAYRNLCLSLTDQILQKPKEAAEFLTLLPALQKDLEEPLVTEEQVMDLLDQYSDGGWGFGLGPVVLLLPEQNRGAALRTVWGKVNETYRGMFLMMLVGEADEELGEGASEFVLGAFPETLSDSNESSYYVQQLVEAKHNQDLVLSMLEAMIARDPQALAARSGRAAILLRRGQEEAALAEAAELYEALLDVPQGDWQKDQVRRELLQRFLPEHLDTFLGVLDKAEAEGGRTVDRYRTRFDLLREAGRDDERRALLAEAVEAFPEETDFLMQQRVLLLAEGRRAEALELLLRAIELDPGQRQALLGYWRGMQNPIQALAVKQQLMAEAEGEGPAAEAADSGLSAASGMMALTSLGGFAVLTSAASGSPLDGTREASPSMEKVKEAAGAEDWQLARTQFRRLWREFPKGEQDSRSIMYFGPSWGGRGALFWPADEVEAGETPEPEPSRGGLSDWSESEPVRAEPPRSAYDALAEYEFGVDEMQRLLRSKDARELDQQREVFKGLLRSRILASGEAETLTELVASVSEGHAGKLETTMLLTLLDEHPELQDESTAGVLAELARSVRATDIGPLRALARVQARQGNIAEAQRLYTWLATRAEGSGFYSFDDSPSISQRELLDDVRENLGGDERMAVIDAVIRFADPGDYPWARENFERLVLETYMELLEPAEAFERAKTVLDGATDFREGIRRSVAKLSTVLWAQNGHVERALECLEYGICALDESVVEGDARYWNDPTRPGWWSEEEVRQLFPQDGAKFSAYPDWLRAAGEALRTWRAEDRVTASRAFKALVIIALRLHSVGESAAALDFLHGLAAEECDRNSLLWVVDALRTCGDEGLADSLERDSLLAGTLHIERLHEVVRREFELSGPEAAIALGGPQTEFVLNERLLDVLVEAAEASGDEAEVSRWSELRERARAAKQQLEEIEEQERLEAEAAKAKAGAGL